MVELFLAEFQRRRDDSNDKDDDAVRSISMLKKLESVIWSLVTSNGRSESRLWLCNTIACSDSVTPQAQRELFVSLLRSKPSNLTLASQVLRMIIERRPNKIGHIIAKRSRLLKKFFKGNPQRILQWFSNFAGVGESGHRKGARAISQFSFVNRDVCWEELEWKGNHGQSPAVVATKPHYFLDLDVQRTVENFLKYVPEFWSSEELANSLKDGEILQIDTKFFVDCFVDMMYGENSKDIWEVINGFFLDESFSYLCHHLLILLEEQDLLTFLKSLQKFLTITMDSKCFTRPSYWLEVLLFMLDDCASASDLLLLNAILNQSRQLLRLVRDQEHKDQYDTIEEVLLEMNMSSSSSNAPFLIIKAIKKKKAEVVKLLGLYSWILQYQVLQNCETPESWEALFLKNGISFRRVEKYDLLPDRFSEGSGSDSDGWNSSKSKRKKKQKTKKKRRRDSGRRDADADLDVSSVWQSSDRSWLLSSDGYSSSWNKVDLPEHLAKHCFSTWMKQFCDKVAAKEPFHLVMLHGSSAPKFLKERAMNILQHNPSFSSFADDY
ncbi:hypothetical protein C5167_018555 [Papaver somniferum]|uniref:Uncharacterized protein n=1 Tax=Papaver somniferum TaxID=3469 RepID=A0A4Y7IMJ8_PAPSO|nr:hypothetical protein C5167_018555 [Papaver somniferum]